MKFFVGLLVVGVLLAVVSWPESPKQPSAQPSAQQKVAKENSQNKSVRQSQSRPSRASRWTIRRMLRALPVQAERRAGYDRDLFRHWSDLDGNGCDTREDVLRAENLRRRGSACWDRRGLWYSAYDGVRTRNPSEFDVDHVVPLAEAWDSGARTWSARRRERFANDLWPWSLRAVSASSNRQKSDSDPASWLPPRQRFHCRYALEWVAVKYRWRLAVDAREKRALRGIAKDCPRTALRARPPLA